MSHFFVPLQRHDFSLIIEIKIIVLLNADFFFFCFSDVIKSTIAPLMKKLCESALESDDRVLCVIAQEFGKLALGLESKNLTK